MENQIIKDLAHTAEEMKSWDELSYEVRFNQLVKLIEFYNRESQKGKTDD